MSITTKPIEFEVLAEPAPGNPFHLAIPVHCMNAARNFYGCVLGLKVSQLKSSDNKYLILLHFFHPNKQEGRRAADNKWQDYSLFGHQLVCHFVGESYRGPDHYNPVDGDEVPVPHFGIVLTESQFHSLSDSLKKAGILFFDIVDEYH